MDAQQIDNVRTERLLLDRIKSLDFEHLRALHSHPEVMAMLGGVRPSEFTESEIANITKGWVQHGFGPWIMREVISSRFVGMGGLFRANIEDIPEVVIGYMLMPEFWGQGLATELARASVHIGLSVLMFSSLVSYTVPANLPSRRVLEKVGLSFERHFEDKGGVRQDLYRVTRAT